jgi:hypothetical protein
VLGFILSGCDPPSWYTASSAGGGKTSKISVASVQFTGTETFTPGTQTPGPAPGQITIQNEIVKGTFAGTLPQAVSVTPPKRKKGASAAGGGRVRIVSGTFVARLSGTYTPSTGIGTFNGVQLLRFTPAKIGDACLTFNSNVTNRGSNEQGNFTLVGGTKAAARGRFSGDYQLIVTQTAPNTATITGLINGSGKVGKPARGLSADCQTLAAQL